jgi:hypothetical protein
MVLYVFVTMAFSGGIPILYAIAAVFFFVTYWVDKILLLKFYRKPPNYSIKMANGVAKWFKWALLMHFIVSY